MSRKKNGIDKSCLNCKMKFYVPKNRMEKDKFCSVFCVNYFKRKLYANYIEKNYLLTDKEVKP